MRFRISHWLFILTCCLLNFHTAAAKKIHNKQYKFKITVPDAMDLVINTDSTVAGDLYFDSAANIVLMISERQSKFNSVKDYIDCSREQLESQLKYFYADSSLTLISCNRSVYYAYESTVIVFSVSVLPYGFNTSMVYFIHHKRRDIQFSFTYNKEAGKESARYIDGIMQTLKLR